MTTIANPIPPPKSLIEDAAYYIWLSKGRDNGFPDGRPNDPETKLWWELGELQVLGLHEHD